MSAGAVFRSLFYILQPGMDINSRVDGARGRPYVDPTPAAWILFHLTSQLSGLTHKLVTKESQRAHWANNEHTPEELKVFLGFRWLDADLQNFPPAMLFLYSQRVLWSPTKVWLLAAMRFAMTTDYSVTIRPVRSSIIKVSPSQHFLHTSGK